MVLEIPDNLDLSSGRRLPDTDWIGRGTETFSRIRKTRTQRNGYSILITGKVVYPDDTLTLLFHLHPLSRQVRTETVKPTNRGVGARMSGVSVAVFGFSQE